MNCIVTVLVYSVMGTPSNYIVFRQSKTVINLIFPIVVTVQNYAKNRGTFMHKDLAVAMALKILVYLLKRSCGLGFDSVLLCL